jgi:hypothetical protein
VCVFCDVLQPHLTARVSRPLLRVFQVGPSGEVVALERSRVRFGRLEHNLQKLGTWHSKNCEN